MVQVVRQELTHSLPMFLSMYLICPITLLQKPFQLVVAQKIIVLTEAFVKSGNPVFDLDVLQELSRAVRRGRVGYLHRVADRAVEFRV